MNPVVHAELGWLSARSLRTRTDRVLVTIAGVAPDLDGLSLLAGQEAYATWHHVLTHGLLAAFVVSLTKGRPAVELFSTRADAAVVETLRRRLGR